VILMVCSREIQKLRDVREKRACYNPSCRKSLGDEPYGDGTGKWFCTESCHTEHKLTVKDVKPTIQLLFLPLDTV
jgi:hypothetical protein